MNYICIVCELEKPDIVCITETWLCDDITMLECSIPGYHCVRCDRHRHGGGANLESVRLAFSDKTKTCLSLQRS